MTLTPMQLIGYTAGIDAILALVSWKIATVHQKKHAGPPSQVVSAFKAYLAWTSVFLVLTSIAMLLLTGSAQAWVVFLSDLALWIALLYFIHLALINQPAPSRMIAATIFVILAGAATLYQIPGLLGTSSIEFGPLLTYILKNMAALLMYGVWIPSAILFFIESTQTKYPNTRIRLLLLAIGLILITFSWAWRLLIASPSVYVVVVASILGFISILGGVIYRRT